MIQSRMMDRPVSILALHGSPRRNGNSSALLSRFVAGARDKGATDITELWIRDIVMSPCLEIYRCKETGRCAIDDGFQRIHDLIDTVDVVAISSPVMFYTVSAHTKMLMDRCQAFWARKYIMKKPGRRKQGYYFCTGATKGARLFDGIAMTMRYFFDAIDCDINGSVTVRGVDEAGEIGNQPGELERAYELGCNVPAVQLSRS